MSFTTLIDTVSLTQHLADPRWALVDCRFSLQDPERGLQAYRAGHIAGALYAHLDRDLSGPVEPGRSGRHPLPSVAHFAQTLCSWGIDQTTQVVAYDDAGGAMAARLWWMLRWLGHEAVAVLDGGWPRWLQSGGGVRAGDEGRPPARFAPNPHPELLVDTAQLEALRSDPALLLIDARAPDRFRGENETLDPVAGHIPGAVNLPYAANLGADGCFQPPSILRRRYETALGSHATAQTVLYCGSGVTAAHNALALLYAGLGEARLYAGSWSEWITDPRRPVATG